MNTKAAIGLVAAIIVLAGAFFITHRTEAPAAFAPEATTTPVVTPTGSSTPIKALPGVPNVTQTAVVTPGAAPSGPKKAARIANYDTSSLTSTSAHPVITGTANVSTVGIVLIDPKGVGIAGSSDIPVVNGHWSFPVPQALKSGSYTVHLIGGDTTNMTQLKVVVE